MHVLAVEDEPGMAELLRSSLVEEGYQVTVASDGESALALAGSGAFDVIVLDLMLPRLDGLSVARKLRQRHVNTPVLVLTARDTNVDLIAALDGGADDYLTKPFSLEVLLARIRAVSRRGPIPQPVCFEFEGLTLNTATREVSRSGTSITLTRREYSLLELLMRHRGRVLTRQQIVAAVWGFDADIEDNTLDAFMRLLRNKVELPGTPRLLHTVRGIGYTLRGKE